MVISRRWSMTSNDSSSDCVSSSRADNTTERRQSIDNTTTTNTDNKKAAALPSIFRSDTVTNQLQQVFTDLASERKRRQGLEAKVKALEEQVAVSPAAALAAVSSATAPCAHHAHSHHNHHHHHDALSRQQATALHVELEGYRQLIDALTHDKPAIAAALQATEARQIAARRGTTTPAPSSSLPLYAIQLLEIMPWDPKAQEVAFGTEELYEWQVYNPQHKAWTSELRHFPLLFQALPTQNLQDNKSDSQNNALRQFLSGAGSSKQSSVLTDASLTHLVNVRAGYPLPQDGGTWQWVGGWRFNNNDDETLAKSSSSSIMNNLDDEGWSYAADPGHFLASNDVAGCPGTPGQVTDDKDNQDDTGVLRTIRRRRWTRRRVLVDYPHASEASKRFLQLLAQNASLTIAANTISDQLVATKMTLTQTELDRQKAEAAHAQRVKELESELSRQQAQVTLLEQRHKLEQDHYKQPQSLVSFPPYLQQPASSGNRNRSKDLLQRPEQLRSLIANIVGGSQRKLNVVPNVEEDDGQSTASASSTGSANPAAPEETTVDPTIANSNDKENVSSLLEFSTTDIPIYSDPDADPKEEMSKKNMLVSQWKQLAMDKIKEAQQVSGAWLPNNKDAATTTAAPPRLQPSLNLQDYEDEAQPWSTADEMTTSSTTS